MSTEKHHEALRTIGEAANDVGVATHVLRFWESKFSQIKPQKRRGRRYYRTEDITTIKTIKELLYDQGYTIKGVHKHLKNIKKQDPSVVTQNSSVVAEAPKKDVFDRDLFGSIIVNKEDSGKLLPEFGAVEIAKLKHIYRGLCASRNKLNNS